MIVVSVFVLILNTALAIRHTGFGNAFSALPSSGEWQDLVSSLSGSEIKDMVHAYMAPIMEFQKAARNRAIDPAQLKGSFDAAINLLQESAKNFHLTSDEFQYAKKDVESFLVMPRAAFGLKKAEELAPVFNVETLENFSQQRLKHILGTNTTSYISFLMRKNSYQNTLEEWISIGTRMPKCHYREIFARNLDLPYIQHSIAVYLNVMRIRGGKGHLVKKLPNFLQFITKFEKDNIVKKIEAMGNGYSTSKPPYSGFLIVVCTVYALLFTVLF